MILIAQRAFVTDFLPMHGKSLSECFVDDFSLFSIDDFKAIDSDVRRNLRGILRKREVYVPKRQNTLIAYSLFQVVHKDILWPSEDSKKPHLISTTSTKDHVSNNGISLAQYFLPSTSQNIAVGDRQAFLDDQIGYSMQHGGINQP